VFIHSCEEPCRTLRSTRGVGSGVCVSLEVRLTQSARVEEAHRWVEVYGGARRALLRLPPARTRCRFKRRRAWYGYQVTWAEGDERTEDTEQHQTTSSDQLAHQASCISPAAASVTVLTHNWAAHPPTPAHPQISTHTPRCPCVVLWTPCSGVEWRVFEPTIRVWRSGTTR
jgi:hypothetical protein